MNNFSNKKPLSKNPLNEKASPESNHKKCPPIHEGHLNPLKQGSAAVEAALCVPVFLIALLAVLYIANSMKIQNSIQYDIFRSSYEYACYENKMVSTTVMTKYRIPVVWDDDEGVVYADTSIRVPFFSGYDPSIRLYIPMTFSDYSGVSMQEEDRDEEWVYVTENASVCHRSRECTYLRPEVEKISTSEAEKARNRSGGKYYKCTSCCKSGGTHTEVFITKYGTRYHTDRNCPRIMHDIHRVKKKETGGLPLCSKCGGSITGSDSPAEDQ